MTANMQSSEGEGGCEAHENRAWTESGSEGDEEDLDEDSSDENEESGGEAEVQVVSTAMGNPGFKGETSLFSFWR